MSQENVSMSESENQQLYFKYREELYKSLLSNAENLDKTIITLSSASLGLSVVLLDKLIPLTSANFLSLLCFSWLSFGLSVGLVITSYLLGQKAIRFQLDCAEKFYLGAKPEFFNKENRYYSYCERATFWSSILFVTGLIILISFTVLNLNKGENMSDKKTIPVQESAPILPMPQISASKENRAAPILPMVPNHTASQPSVIQPVSSSPAPVALTPKSSD
jgi:hypothetical protein